MLHWICTVQEICNKDVGAYLVESGRNLSHLVDGWQCLQSWAKKTYCLMHIFIKTVFLMKTLTFNLSVNAEKTQACPRQHSTVSGPDQLIDTSLIVVHIFIYFLFYFVFTPRFLYLLAILQNKDQPLKNII